VAGRGGRARERVTDTVGQRREICSMMRVCDTAEVPAHEKTIQPGAAANGSDGVVFLMSSVASVLARAATCAPLSRG
jgi:hypothetical protein